MAYQRRPYQQPGYEAPPQQWQGQMYDDQGQYDYGYNQSTGYQQYDNRVHAQYDQQYYDQNGYEDPNYYTQRQEKRRPTQMDFQKPKREYSYSEVAND